MARIFIDGFETGDMSTWDGVYNVAPLVNAAQTGMSGTYNIYTSTGYRAGVKVLNDMSELYCGWRQIPVNYSSWDKVPIQFMKGGTRVGYVRIDVSTYQVHAYRHNNIWLATGTHILTEGNPVHIQVRYVPDPVSGIFQIKVNDILDVDFSGQTSNTETDVDLLWFGELGLASSSYFDDFVLDDSTWPGESRIAPCIPNGAGASTQFTPSAGANYTCVDETPPDSGDYVYTNTVSLDDLYTLGDLPGDVISVKCVQASARAWKDGGATPQNIELLARSGGTTYGSGDKPLPSEVGANIRHLWETDPDTASPWAIAAVDALEAGIRSKT